MESTVGASNSAEASADRAQRRRRKRKGASRNTEPSPRYFLWKAVDAAGGPQLGQECRTESEALVKSLKAGKPFLEVTAWEADYHTVDGMVQVIKVASRPKPPTQRPRPDGTGQ